MDIDFCVQLWVRPGHENELIAYEDDVLALLDRHDGSLLQRARARDAAEQPYEVQIIRFASEAGFDRYMADPERTARSDERDRAIERTQLTRVDLI